ncbi:MAG: membrane protein insertion efficiency factor YidD [Desulfobacteraceae bacterium]|nr:membrane protein insertion efficiency factor YidD [Desulfobacteraceae bacterium]
MKVKTITWIPLLAIKFYQYVISPVLGPSCRYFPSCSEYAYQAIAKYGIIKGVFLSAKRILRCHPFCSGGIDPVP